MDIPIIDYIEIDFFFLDEISRFKFQCKIRMIFT